MMNTRSLQRKGCASLFTLTILASANLVAGADWPQFMGPNGDGTSPEKGLVRSWPSNGPKVLWTITLGPGYGGAAIRDGQVFVLDRVDQKQDVLRCLDLVSGKEAWTFSYDAPGRIDHDGSRSTPTVTDKHVFIIGPFGHFHCLDRATHQVVWKKNLLTDFGVKLPTWAVTQSPLAYKDLVIVAPLSGDVGIVAFEQATGNERWRSAALGNLAYASPKLLTLEGVEQIAIITTKGVAAVAAADGKKLWEHPYSCHIPIPNVSVLGGGKLFVTGGYNAGSLLIQVSRTGDTWGVKELAKIEKMGGQCHPGLVYQDYLYVLCNTNDRSDGMVCIGPDGKVIWKTEKNPYLCKGGSVLTADGLIYVMDGAKGELHIVEPSPSGFKSLSKAKLFDGPEIWGPLALADGKLLVRNQSQMKCLDIKTP
jgi:outer membrane protein assembly factor BamB